MKVYEQLSILNSDATDVGPFTYVVELKWSKFQNYSSHLVAEKLQIIFIPPTSLPKKDWIVLCKYELEKSNNYHHLQQPCLDVWSRAWIIQRGTLGSPRGGLTHKYRYILISPYLLHLFNINTDISWYLLICYIYLT